MKNYLIVYTSNGLEYELFNCTEKQIKAVFEEKRIKEKCILCEEISRNDKLINFQSISEEIPQVFQMSTSFLKGK